MNCWGKESQRQGGREEEKEEERERRERGKAERERIFVLEGQRATSGYTDVANGQMGVYKGKRGNLMLG